MLSDKIREEKKIDIMEKSFDCYSENGLSDTGIKALARACGMTSGNLYAYFENVDDLVVQSTAWCMAKVEEEFMALSPRSTDDIRRFLDEVPAWTAKRHGKKYRLMYQVYTSPKYLDAGKEFFRGVEQRYTDYARQLEPRLGIPWQVIQPMIFTFVRATVHYALFEEEAYLRPQMEMLWQMCLMLKEKYNVPDQDLPAE